MDPTNFIVQRVKPLPPKAEARNATSAVRSKPVKQKTRITLLKVAGKH